ncbi:MAG: energy-coupling factor transporter transmembrane protein EcfT [Lachnospiraceae bacterium]|nr:energy-coupling factor transporter transmembrane protein EcfT [Lachnospiraceae bacterium]
MKAFESYNPIFLFVYFLTVTVISMFAFNPVMIAIALVSGILMTLVLAREGCGRFFIYTVFIFVVTSAANPVFSHNGVTVLFVMNDNPVTLEAVLYGVGMGTLICAILMIMRVFTRIMTGDKMLCVMGSASPKLALLITMTFRFIPLFHRQAVKTELTQRALGRYNGENAIDTIRMKLKIFSMMTTWGLENGIVTADSMSARGYGSGRRTSFSVYRFRKADAVMLAVLAVFAGAVAFFIATDAVRFSYYPQMSGIAHTPAAIVCYVLYGLMCLLPVMNELEEKIKWRYLESGILSSRTE